MTSILESASSHALPGHVVYATRADRLAAARRRGVTLCIVPRRLRPGVARYAETLRDVPIAIDAVVRVAAVAPELTSALDAAGCAPCPARDAWIADMSRLARSVGRLQHGGDRVRVRVERVTDDSCRFFHVDYVHLRLITTYMGRGSQWLANADVERAMLGKPGPSPDAVNARITGGRDAVRELPPGWIAVMKGEAYPKNAGNGLVHRSTPIEGSGEIRIRFCVDTACC